MPLNEEAMMSLLGNPDPRAFGLGNRLMSAAKPLLGNSDFALALLANSGHSPQKRSFGEILGTSGMQAQQMGQQRQDDALKRRLMQAQIGNLPNQGKTSNVRDYEFLKGLSPEEQARFMSMSGTPGGGDPSEVRAFKYWDSLDPEKQQDFLKLKRNVGSDYAIETVNGVPTVVYKPAAGDKGRGGTPLVTPLTNLAAQAAGAETVKQAEGRGGALGRTQGDITGEIQKKGSNSQTVIGLVDEAEKLLKESTGSLIGTGVDKGAAVFGLSTPGARAVARLRVIQASLMMNMPRMEGPQGEKDVELYQQAAAQLGDSTVPAETRQAALGTIRELQNKYAERAAGLSGGESTTKKQPTLDEIRAKYGR